MTNAVIYTRISQDREGAGLGVKRQEADCLALAQQLGVTVTATYTDNDLSAYSGKPRKGYEDLLTGLKAGQWETVLTWHTDRLHRSPVELERYITVSEKIPTHTVKAGVLDLATASGRMVARMLGAAARYESEHKSERQRAKHLELAKAGKAGGGQRAFGYASDKETLIPAEAAVVREVADQLVGGMSLRAVANGLNTRGIPTVTGRPWGPTVIRAMITRPRYVGVREHQGVSYPATWAPILDKDTHEALVAMFTDPARTRTHGNARVHLLAGIVRCADCGGPMILHCGGQHRPERSRNAYRCVPCKHYVAQYWCDEFVIEEVLNVLDDPRLTRAVQEQTTGGDHDEDIVADGLQELQRIGRELAGHPGVSAAVISGMTAGIQERVDLARARMAAQATSRARIPHMEAMDRPSWDSLPLATRRAIVERLTLQIVVSRPARAAREFQPERILIEWTATRRGAGPGAAGAGSRAPGRERAPRASRSSRGAAGSTGES